MKISALDSTLLLLGHGSHYHPDSSRPVREHAQRLADRGQWGEVRLGFWKEEPGFSRCLDGCEARRVIAVPLFMSSGYFTEQVIPRELRLEERTDVALDIRLAEPVGLHPRMVDVLEQRAREAGAGPESAVVVLGHGTTRNRNSERAIYDQSRALHHRQCFAEVGTIFLDQEPGLDEVWNVVAASDMVVVPMFTADGWHVDDTIPDDMGLRDGMLHQGERRVRFGKAVGTHPGMVDVIQELAEGQL